MYVDPLDLSSDSQLLQLAKFDKPPNVACMLTRDME